MNQDTRGTVSHPGMLLAIILASYLMIVLDISIVITGLPKIQAELQLSATDLSWVQNAYTLVFGGLLLLGARAGDILGRRRMFTVGLGIFTVSSLAIGIAQSAIWLLAARALQGVGAAILAPSTLALLSANFAEGPARTRAIGLYGSIAGIGASAGLVLGGILADMLSWRVGFFINLPIGIALMLGAQRYLTETERRAGQFDLLGAISSTLGMAALVFGLVHAASAGWQDPVTQGALVCGVVLMAVLVWNEARVAQPIMPLRLFASRERSAAYLGRMLFLGGMLGFWFFTTQYLQAVLGFSPLAAGLAFLITTLPNFATALLVPRLTHRFGNQRILTFGLLVATLGLFGLAYATSTGGSLALLAVPMMLIGIGQGGTLSPLTIAGVAGVAKEDAGAASGLVNAAHQLGGSLGLAILVVVFASAHPHLLDSHAELAQRISAAMFAASALLSMSWIVVVSVRHSPAQ
ncbi:MAG: putative transrane efflux protein [Proteobacteria bacterium]|nr:putative transrane efflux protein [Pseudomonadota bacterium]